MKEIKGNIIADSAIDNFLAIMGAKWDETKDSGPWWKFWKKSSFSRITNFFLNAIDDLIAYVDDVIENGADKKATVLDAVSKLYDYVEIEALPLWLKPFSSQVKQIVVYGMVSAMIDWMVEKYRNGSWRKKTATELAASWSEKAALLNGTPFGHRPI